MDHYISWWNVENLFDIQNAPDRPAWFQEEIEGELEGWTQAVLDQKIEQLASIIMQVNGGEGPDLLGVCEVESEKVLNDLVDALAPLGRRYAVAHHDTSDRRGIDVAFIYDADRFEAEEQFFYVVLKRNATRDLFQVNFRTTAGRLLMVIGNHWPSRSGGVYVTQPYRILAAETLSYWHQRILEIQGKEAAIVTMGDFNDEPFDRAVTEYALSVRIPMKVRNATSRPLFYNLAWPIAGHGVGTYYYNNFPNVLDQLMVSRGILRGTSGFTVRRDLAAVEPPVPIEQLGTEQRKLFQGMGPVRLEVFAGMFDTGDYPKPERFSRPARASFNPQGYSDHFPISMVLHETD